MKTTFRIHDGSDKTLYTLIKIRECLDRDTGYIGHDPDGLFLECDDADAATVRALINDGGIDIADVKHY